MTNLKSLTCIAGLRQYLAVNISREDYEDLTQTYKRPDWPEWTCRHGDVLSIDLESPYLALRDAVRMYTQERFVLGQEKAKLEDEEARRIKSEQKQAAMERAAWEEVQRQEALDSFKTSIDELIKTSHAKCKALSALHLAVSKTRDMINPSPREHDLHGLNRQEIRDLSAQMDRVQDHLKAEGLNLATLTRFKASAQTMEDYLHHHP